MRLCPYSVAYFCCFFLGILPISAQFVSNPLAIPDTGKPPVIFLNGYETDCGSASFQKSFGIADQLLQSIGRTSLFFNNCTVSGSPSIEKLGAVFSTYLQSLTYTNGRAVSSVDVVGYSMGGLIVRSDLSGKQEALGSFTPPANPVIGKAIFIATPNFGTPVAGLAFGFDTRTDELSSGSTFLMDLNTWNQNHDDLRGVDAIALAGTGGTGIVTTSGGDDGLVPVGSASLRFYAPGRTRVLPLCHVTSPGLITLTGLCAFTSKGISRVVAVTDDNARIIASFLSGTTEWQTVGVAAEQNPLLQSGAGLRVRARTADDVRINPSSVRAAPSTGSAKNLNMSNNEIAYTDLIGAGNVDVTVNATAPFTQSVNLQAGGAQAFVVKQGPRIDAVVPAAAALLPRVIAPRMIVAIYGVGMAQSTVALNGTALSTFYVSDTQINAALPSDASIGLGKLTVRNASGSHTVNVLLEAAFPTVFTLDQSGSGAAGRCRCEYRPYRHPRPSTARGRVSGVVRHRPGWHEDAERLRLRGDTTDCHRGRPRLQGHLRRCGTRLHWSRSDQLHRTRRSRIAVGYRCCHQREPR